MSGDVIDFKSKLKRGSGDGGGGPSPPSENQERITEALLEYLTLSDLEELSGLMVCGIDTKGKATKPMAVFDKTDTLFKLSLITKEMSLVLEDQSVLSIEPRPGDNWEDEDI